MTARLTATDLLGVRTRASMAGEKARQVRHLNYGTPRCSLPQLGECTAAFLATSKGGSPQYNGFRAALLEGCQAQTRSKRWLQQSHLQSDGHVNDVLLQHPTWKFRVEKPWHRAQDTCTRQPVWAVHRSRILCRGRLWARLMTGGQRFSVGKHDRNGIVVGRPQGKHLQGFKISRAPPNRACQRLGDALACRGHLLQNRTSLTHPTSQSVVMGLQPATSSRVGGGRPRRTRLTQPAAAAVACAAVALVWPLPALLSTAPRPAAAAGGCLLPAASSAPLSAAEAAGGAATVAGRSWVSAARWRAGSEMSGRASGAPLAGSCSDPGTGGKPPAARWGTCLFSIAKDSH